jgi:hypothetical protein
VVGYAGFEVLVEPPVAFVPGVGLALAQGLGQVLAHQRVSVDGWRIGLFPFDQAAGFEAAQDDVPLCGVQVHQRFGQAGNGGCSS